MSSIRRTRRTPSSISWTCGVKYLPDFYIDRRADNHRLTGSPSRAARLLRRAAGDHRVDGCLGRAAQCQPSASGVALRSEEGRSEAEQALVWMQLYALAANGLFV